VFGFRVLLALALAVVALGPATAAAGTARVEDGAAIFEGAPGERNDVDVSGAGFAPNWGKVSIADRLAPITAGPGCSPSQQEADTVVCDVRPSDVIRPSLIRLGDGDDAARVQTDRYLPTVVMGGPGDDQLRQDSTNNSPVALYGEDGDDRLVSEGPGSGLAGDVVDGGPGADTITSSVVAQGGEGDDTLIALQGPWLSPLTRDQVFSGILRKPGWLTEQDWDTLPTSCSIDDPRGFLNGGPGADTLIGSAGFGEQLAGGAGPDRISAREGDDMLSGGDGDDVLDGGDGDDRLYGDGGADALAGGPGGDALDGGAGPDTLSGGAGVDGVCFWLRRRGVTVDLRTPGGDGEPGEDDTVADAEIVVGSDLDDSITAGAAPLRVDGGDGDDAITGGRGDDQFDGGSGRDRLSGGPGADALFGGREREVDGGSEDTIDGGPGDDLLVGGYGADWLSAGPGHDYVDATDSNRWPSAPPPLEEPLPDPVAVNFSPIVSLAHEDQVWCGPDADRVVAEFPDAIGPDCEESSDAAVHWRRVTLRRRRPVEVKARCAWQSSAPCRGIARLLPAVRGRGAAALAGGAPPAWCPPLPRPERPLARARLEVRGGRVGRIPIGVTKRGRALVARRGCVPVTVALQFEDADGRRHGSTRTLTLTRRGFRVPAR
jgi:Ca2+-binding RTX toxin-like protein